MEAKWQKNHTEILEQEMKKNKLHGEIEDLIKQKRELVEELAKLRKEVSVHGGDYDEITAERIKVVNELDEKYMTLRIETDEKSEKQATLYKTINLLQNRDKELTEKLERQRFAKNKLSDEIEKLNLILDELKIERQNEEERKRRELKRLKEEYDKTKEELRLLRAELLEKKEKIVKEERLLSIKRSDLEIYEARMRKKYPDETFVLK